jgi:hypothetical protein
MDCLRTPQPPCQTLIFCREAAWLFLVRAATAAFYALCPAPLMLAKGRRSLWRYTRKPNRSCRGGFYIQTAFQAQRAAIVAERGHAVPVRRWHATGHCIGMLSSLLIAVVIGVFFFGLRGWSPPEAWQIKADFAVTWLLLTYIWVQMGSLILVGADTKNQMWLDAFTSVVPLFLIFYSLISRRRRHRSRPTRWCRTLSSTSACLCS